MSKVFIGLTEAQVRERGLDVPEYDDEEEEDEEVKADLYFEKRGGSCTVGELKKELERYPDDFVIDGIATYNIDIM